MKTTFITLTFLLFVPPVAMRADDQTKPAKQPNIVIFLVDDMGWQETSVPFHTAVTALNRRYRTPNMERLAADGMKFTQAYASALCSPTRVSLLTGMNAARHRVTNWTLRKNTSPDRKNDAVSPPAWNVNGMSMEAGDMRSVQATPWSTLLRRAGYRTIHVGKWHMAAKGMRSENPLNVDFDVNIAGHAAGGPGSYWGENNYSAAFRKADRIWDVPGLEAYHGTKTNLTEALTLEAIKAVEKSVADKKPFCLYMAHYAIHAPNERDDRFYKKYVDAGLKPAEATLASMIESMDKSLGDLRAALKRLGVEDDTIILFMSDNGAPSTSPRNLPLRGFKITPYEGGIRVPMLVSWPGKTKPGSVCNDPIIIEDYFPTILEMAGAKGDTIQKVDGISFVPLLNGAGKTPADRAFVWHYPHTYGQTPYSIIRVGPWKLIYHHIGRRMELFNLDTDISEATNLAAQRPEKTNELATRLAEVLQERGAQMPTDLRTGKLIELPKANGQK